jgi:hypothetical protein
MPEPEQYIGVGIRPLPDTKNDFEVFLKSSVDGEWHEQGFGHMLAEPMSGLWRAMITDDGQSRELGSFPTQEAALIAILHTNELHFLLSR